MHDVTIKVSAPTPKKKPSRRHIQTFFRHPLAGLLGILFIFALIPLTIFMAQQQQDIRQHAAGCTIKNTRSDTITVSGSGAATYYQYTTWDPGKQSYTDNPPKTIGVGTAGQDYKFNLPAGSYQIAASLADGSNCLGWITVAGDPGEKIDVASYFKNTSGKQFTEMTQSISGSTIYNVHNAAGDYYDAYLDQGGVIYWLEDHSPTPANGSNPANFVLTTAANNFGAAWLTDSMQINVPYSMRDIKLDYRNNSCGAGSTAVTDFKWDTTVIKHEQMAAGSLGTVDSIQIKYDYFGEWELFTLAKDSTGKGLGIIAWARYHHGETTPYAQKDYFNNIATQTVQPQCTNSCSANVKSACSFTPVSTPTAGSTTPGAPTPTTSPGTPTATPGPGTPTAVPGTPTTTTGPGTPTPTGTGGGGGGLCGYTFTNEVCSKDADCHTGEKCVASVNTCAAPPTTIPASCGGGGTPTATPASTTTTPGPTGTQSGKTGNGTACTVDSAKVTVVFVGDSYDTDAHFQADVQTAENALKSVEPYKSYPNIFNFETLDNPSQSHHCTNALKPNELNIGCISEPSVRDSIDQAILTKYPSTNKTQGYKKVSILVNASPDAYENAGGTTAPDFEFTVIQNHDKFETAFLHELGGHAVGNLYDRYLYNNPPAPTPSIGLIAGLNSNCSATAGGESWWKDLGGTASTISGGGTPGQGCVQEQYYAPSVNSCSNPRDGTPRSVMSRIGCYNQPITSGAFDVYEQYWIKNYIINQKYVCNVTSTGGGTPTVTPTGNSTQVFPAGSSVFQKVNINQCATVCNITTTGKVCTLSCPTLSQ